MLHPPCRRHLSPQLVRLLAELQDVWNCSLHSLDDFHRPTLRTIKSKCPKLVTTKCRSYNRMGTASAPWWTGNLSFPTPYPRRETKNGWMDTLRHKTCSITVPVSNFKKERRLQGRAIKRKILNFLYFTSVTLILLPLIVYITSGISILRCAHRSVSTCSPLGRCCALDLSPRKQLAAAPLPDRWGEVGLPADRDIMSPLPPHAWASMFKEPIFLAVISAVTGLKSVSVTVMPYILMLYFHVTFFGTFLLWWTPTFIDVFISLSKLS